LLNQSSSISHHLGMFTIETILGYLLDYLGQINSACFDIRPFRIAPSAAY